MAAPRTAYHHGDLRIALVDAALDMLDDGAVTELSLRAVARRAGVTTAAPYRHFADRDALLSAVAAVGYRQLTRLLLEVQPDPHTAGDLADIAVTYVRFALDRPGLFRVMFAEGCDASDPDRVAAVTAINDYLKTVVAAVFPSAEAEPMATAMWALVHGLAFLHLDGKLDASDPDEVSHRVASAVTAIAELTAIRRRKR